LTVIGTASVVMAILLGLAEVIARHRRTMNDVGLLDAMIVGFAQCGALIPGVSRSGSSLTAALFLGLQREEAARFSFLIGLPAITAAGVKELWVLYKSGLDPYGWSVLGVGLLVGSISAFAAIWGLMRIIERFSFWPFVVYRAFIGAFLLAAVYFGILAN
jgi:undecaprenyl-diphosphatase